jgi:multidrug efflux pump subunit AcrB
VEVELISSEDRDVSSETLLAEWRAAVGRVPGAEKLTMSARSFGPAATPIEFKLVARVEHADELEAAIELAKTKLAEFNGVFDISDDSIPGKPEYRFRVQPSAAALGVKTADLAETVRAAYYGEEVMRVQRGRHEVKIMVRYPREDRRALANFDEIRVRTDDGVERPFSELAEIDVEQGYSEINRINQLRSITVSADVDEAHANAGQIVGELRETFAKELQAFPHVGVRWEGQQEQTQESLGSLFVGFGVAILAMYVLLAFEFQSYVQPLLILMIIPFGIIGAVGGHAFMGLPITLFSMFGIVALTGIVVNDSIVLIDFINSRVRDGAPIKQALAEAGARRFRPVMLTTVTTIGGLMPILLETSLQAQVLIPMATSIAFGEMFATVLVLFLVPVAYSLYVDMTSLMGWAAEAVLED